MRPEERVGQVLGHYRMIRLLGYGGTANVYLAQDINLQREVAVKVFQPKAGDTKDFLPRFAREARVLAQLDHPHILPIYDYGEQDGIAYLVIPYMPGGSLRERLQGRGPMPIQEAIKLIDQMLNALQYAHDRGLIHRDVKPGNMLFKTDDTLLLADFGLVKVLSNQSDLALSQDLSSITAHAITGTPEYMSPEQISGQVTPATDIYATGIVLYEMLTGIRPFAADTFMGVLMKQMYEQPRPLRAFNPRISPALDAAIMHALVKDPTRRYQRPIHLQRALQQALAAEQTETARTDAASTVPTAWGAPITPPSSSSPSQRAMGSGEQSNDNAPDMREAQELQRGAFIQAQPSAPMTPSAPAQFAAQGSAPFTPASAQRGPHPSFPDGYPPNGQITLGSPRSHTPLIVTLVLIILALAISLGGVLYATRGPHTQPGSTPVVQKNTPPTGPTDTITRGGTTPATTVITSTMPPTQTSCPAAGTARAAVMAPLSLGNNQNIIYIVNEGTPDHPTFGTVKRHDVTADKSIEISKMPNTLISEAQVSQNGQWVLFTANVAGQAQMRLVRVDGQGLQTLYCAPPNANIFGTQWSFDGQSVIFDVGPSMPAVFLLNINSGQLQEEVQPSSAMSFVARTWLDNTHVYMVAIPSAGDAPAQNIYILDTQKGAQQLGSDLRQVVMAPLTCNSFDSSYDSTELIMSTCNKDVPGGSGLGPRTGPSTVTVQPATGGAQTTIYNNSTLAVTTVRSIARTTLLLLIENSGGDTSQNGLWKMNIDGSGLTRLTTDTNNLQSLCSFTQYAWSNVSPDGTMFALQTFDPKTNTYGMYYGSLAGGPLIQFADISGTQLSLVGWTNM